MSADGGNGSGRKVPTRVAIVALGPSSMNYIREVDAAGDRYKLYDETWTFNTYASVIESDRLFHMDDVRVQEIRARGGNKRVANMLEALKRYPGPIYTSFPEPEYPSMVRYPIAEVLSKYDSAYFTTTPPYALAYAGYIGVKEVMLYGCDYTWEGIAGSEAGRAGMEFWVGMLKALGMRINIHPESSLCDARHNSVEDIRLYGYDRARVSLEQRENGKGERRGVLVMRERTLPTAQEIEERYTHRKAGSDLQVDVVN